MTLASRATLDDLTLSGRLRLDELVDRDALAEMTNSFYKLFRIPLRIFDLDGALLADVAAQEPLYAYLNTFRNCRAALAEVVTAVKRINPGNDGEVNHGCVTGAAYRVIGISYDGRSLGRLILGPFLPATLREIPNELLALDPEIDAAKTKELLVAMPRARDETVAQIARHLKRTLDLILFSGHKALLTSSMHMASVRESFRELQEKNTQLQEAFDKLKELDRLKSNFLATVSHELRTPLTSIIGYSEMLAGGIAGPMNEEQTRFVGTIQEKGEQLLDLIKSLLDLSKLESGTMSLRKTHTALAPIVLDVVETLTPLARQAGVNLTSSLDPALPKIWGDAERIRQIVLNLTENAIKFTPRDGHVQLSLEPTSMKSPDEDADVALLMGRRPAVAVTVADTGVGIPEGERTRIFDAFYQVDSGSTREKGGTGLGLSIVKRLVDGHQGTIAVSDNTPNGARFTVTFPCRGVSVG